jgi:hypothetical protein
MATEDEIGQAAYEKLQAELTAIQEKLPLEKQKLEVELKHLRRPILFTQTGIAAVITAVVGLTAALVQYVNSERKSQLAEIQKAQAALDVAKLEETKKERQHEIDTLREQNEALLQEGAKAKEQLAEVERYFHEHPELGGAKALFERLRSENLRQIQALPVSEKVDAWVFVVLSPREKHIHISVITIDTRDSEELTPAYALQISLRSLRGSVLHKIPITVAPSTRDKQPPTEVEQDIPAEIAEQVVTPSQIVIERSETLQTTP